MEIKGNAFFVTGGGSGLGLAVVEEILELGGFALAFDKMEPTVQHPNCINFAGDVLSDGDIQTAIGKISARAPLRGLVNCAGIGLLDKTVRTRGVHDMDIFLKQIQVNLVGTFNASRHVAKAMCDGDIVSEERGVIVHVASIAAFDGQVGQVGYSASKAGVVGMTLPMARDLSEHAIRVVAIAPGPFETPMLTKLPSKRLKELESQIPFPGRVGRPKEFSNLVMSVFANKMLNGCVIRLDGGIRMSMK